MNKKICLITATLLFVFNSTNVFASVDDAISFLGDYQTENNVFKIEEHCSEDNGTKTLFIQANLSYDIEDDKYMDFVNNERDIFREMSNQDWFDYESIYLINFSKTHGKFSDFKEYNISEGTLTAYGYENVTKLPWIINEKEELDDSLVLFIGNVTKEILHSNINDYLDSNPGGIDSSKIDIKESNGVAEVTGNVNSGGKEYEFSVQFTYEVDESMNGTYNTLYVGLNDVPIYGEYNDIDNIQLN